MSVQKLDSDGTWRGAAAVPMTPGVDFEVYMDGSWYMYDGHLVVAKGYAKTRIGRAISMRRARRRYLRGAI